MIEFQLKPGVVRKLLIDENYGRCSAELRAQLLKLGKTPAPVDTGSAETDALVLEDIYHSENTQAGDGMSQLYLARCADPGTAHVWSELSAAVVKIAIVGGIPGAAETD